jgi:hypothetical protein
VAQASRVATANEPFLLVVRLDLLRRTDQGKDTNNSRIFAVNIAQPRFNPPRLIPSLDMQLQRRGSALVGLHLLSLATVHNEPFCVDFVILNTDPGPGLNFLELERKNEKPCHQTNKRTAVSDARAFCVQPIA